MADNEYIEDRMAIFEYLEWVKMYHPEIKTLQETQNRDLVMEWGKERHDHGLPFNGLILGVCMGWEL